MGDYFSVHESTVVTIYPHDAKRIESLMNTVKDTDKLVQVLQKSLS